MGEKNTLDYYTLLYYEACWDLGVFTIKTCVFVYMYFPFLNLGASRASKEKIHASDYALDAKDTVYNCCWENVLVYGHLLKIAAQF